jgi:hypothetical protein
MMLRRWFAAGTRLLAWTTNVRSCMCVSVYSYGACIDILERATITCNFPLSNDLKSVAHSPEYPTFLSRVPKGTDLQYVMVAAPDHIASLLRCRPPSTSPRE